MERKKTKLTQAEISAIRKMWEDNQSPKQMSAELDIPLNLVLEFVTYLDDNVPMPTTTNKKVVNPSIRQDAPRTPITPDEIMDFVKVQAKDFWKFLKGGKSND